MELTQEAVEILLDEETPNQSFKIANIEVRIMYNYLIDRLFMDVLGGGNVLLTNILINPNMDLFSGVYFTDDANKGMSVGSLIFSHDDDIIKLDNWKKSKVFYYLEGLKI